MGKLPLYQIIDGIRYSHGFSPDLVRSAQSYVARPDDVFVVTYPKCGTTWMHQIVYLIFNRGQPPSDATEYIRSRPFLEFTGAQSAQELKRPGALKTHQPFHTTPYSSEAKYIYVARNPKDCCVSFYYHTKMFPEYEFQDGRFDDYFELFVRGEVEFGDYFDNLLSWYDHRNDPNVFFTTYEQMKTDFVGVVKELAAFLGPQYAEMLAEKNDGEAILEKICRYSSFDFMKIEVNTFLKELFSDSAEAILSNPDVPSGMKVLASDPATQAAFKPLNEDAQVVRKGVIGDWRNHFSQEQNQRMDEYIAHKTKHSPGVLDLWKDFHCL